MAAPHLLHARVEGAEASPAPPTPTAQDLAGGVLTRGRTAVHLTKEAKAPHTRVAAKEEADPEDTCQAASMGALLLTAGATGGRFALPHARIMIHQPLGGFQGQATDIDIHAKEILRIKDELNQIMSKHSGQKLKTVEKDTERDNFMSAQEAKEYGLIDDVIEQRPV